MKKLLSILAIMMCATTIVSAQEPTSSGGFESFFTTFAALVAAIPIVVEFIKKLIGKTSETKNIYVQIISWITGLALTMVGWFMNLGFLAEIDLVQALIYGVGASLAANGIADTKLIQNIIKTIIGLFKK